MKLLPNTYKGLTWGLTHFDGIETDIRLTQDNKLVIFHDAHLEDGRKLENMTVEELEAEGIPTLEKFFSIPEVIELSNTKKMYIELKPNCNGGKRVVEPIKDQFFKSFQEVVEKSEINTNTINIISFCLDLLDPFAAKYPCYPLLPDVNECTQSFLYLRVMPQVLGRSLKTEIKRSKKRGFAGVFFARQYLMGFASIRHPSYENAVAFADEYDMLLGTNLGTPELEDKYPRYARFSDKLSDYPRNAGEGEGPIIAHRGTGTKGVEVPEEDIPQLSF